LCAQASNESDVEKAKILHEAADSASNTYRRLMQSFDERRKPSRQPIGQTNVARQQIVQNIRSDGQKKITNELGSIAILPRRYHLTAQGRRALRAAIIKTSRGEEARGPGRLPERVVQREIR
jgi:hypothetical protein